MGFITSQTRDGLVDGHQHIGSLIGELKVISISHLWDRFFTKDKWFENQTVILLKEGAKVNWQHGLSHLYTEKWARRQRSRRFKKKKTKKGILTHVQTHILSNLAIKRTPESFPLFCIHLFEKFLFGQTVANKRKKYEINRNHSVKFLIFLFEVP